MYYLGKRSLPVRQLHAAVKFKSMYNLNYRLASVSCFVASQFRERTEIRLRHFVEQCWLAGKYMMITATFVMNQRDKKVHSQTHT
jgi:hypothetical protein